MIVTNVCIEPPILPRRVKLLAIDANWFSGTYCRN